jgi:hypothetical protein
MKKAGRSGRLTPSDQFVNVSTTSVEKNKEYDKTLNDLLTAQTQLQDAIYSREGTFNTLAEQIAGLTGGVRSRSNMDAFNQAVSALGGERNYGASDLGTRLNFQVSDQQIVDDYNTTRLGRLNRIVEDGNSQIAGIQARLDAANQLFGSLPANDPRRTSAKVSIDQLKADLNSVQGAVTKAGQQITDFKPITPADAEGLREITAFREFIKLPEERASEQLKQIDPESYQSAVGLGQRYRQLATEELPATTTPQTEQLRQTIEQEALNQLRLGSTLGAEERRGYEQAVRAAQTARGNIFGLGPAVQEAAQIGAAGEQRKLARFGAAQQFLASGETTGGAAARDLALRESFRQTNPCLDSSRPLVCLINFIRLQILRFLFSLPAMRQMCITLCRITKHKHTGRRLGQLREEKQGHRHLETLQADSEICLVLAGSFHSVGLPERFTARTIQNGCSLGSGCLQRLQII